MNFFLCFLGGFMELYLLRLDQSAVFQCAVVFMPVPFTREIFFYDWQMSSGTWWFSCSIIFLGLCVLFLRYDSGSVFDSYCLSLVSSFHRVRIKDNVHNPLLHFLGSFANFFCSLVCTSHQYPCSGSSQLSSEQWLLLLLPLLSLSCLFSYSADS